MASSMLASKQRHKPLQQRPLAMLACSMVAGILFGAYLLIHEFEDYIHLHPGVTMLYPLAGMTTIAAILPLCLFVSYEDDFKGLIPIIPTHYVRICIKAYTALHRNQWKVAEKDM